MGRLGNRYEDVWNALLVEWLRADGGTRDSAAHLRALASRVARREAAVHGTRIGADALTRARSWDAARRRERIAAARAESLGTARQVSGYNEESKAPLRDALTIYTRLGEARRRARVLGTLGSSHFSLGEFAAAESLYLSALHARRAIGDSSLVGRALNTLGQIDLWQGRPERAIEWFSAARRVREQLGERRPLAITLKFLASAARDAGRPDSAGVWLDQALDLAVALGDSSAVGEILVTRASALLAEGSAPAAIASAERARARSDETGSDKGAIQARHVLGNALCRQGRYWDGLRSLEAGARLARASGLSIDLLEVLVSLSSGQVELADHDGAFAVLAEADSLARALGDPRSLASLSINLCNAHRQAGHPNQAATAGRAALRAAEAGGDSLLVAQAAASLGQLSLARRAWEEAVTFYARAAAAAGRDSVTALICEINRAGAESSSGRLDDAERRFGAAAATAARYGLDEHLWAAILGLGDVAERRGDVDGALAHYRDAAARIDSLRARQGPESGRVTFYAGRVYPAQAIVHLLTTLEQRHAGRGHAGHAFLWAERARARGLLDLRAGGGAAELVGLDAARDLVRHTDEALLVYSTNDSSTTLWTITTRGVSCQMLPSAPELEPLVQRFRRAIASPRVGAHDSTRTLSEQLCRIVFEPAAIALRGVRRLRIVPDGLLGAFPFEALVSPRDRRYLVERFDISYAPSVSLLTRVAGEARGHRGGVFAVGDPAYGPDGPVALPETASELDSLRALTPARGFHELRDSSATCRAVLTSAEFSRSELLHFAVHGRSDQRSPDLCGLFLAPEADDDGFLSATEIARTRIDAELVVASSCQSGVGRLVEGEGSLSLARAFLGAGSRSVMFTHWPVGVVTSGRLANGFYRRLLTDGAPRDRALGDAQRAMLADPATRAPYYWAGFVLSGERGALRAAGARR